MKDKFIEVSSGLTRYIDFNKYPFSIFFFKKEKWMFEYNLENGYLWCRSDLVWHILNDKNKYRYEEIQYFIKNQVEEHFKTKPITPARYKIAIATVVEEHFKTKPITPVCSNGYLGRQVEEHFKTKPITPGSTKANVLKRVEEHFKTKPITPQACLNHTLTGVEEHFKTKPITPHVPAVIVPTVVEEHFKTKPITPHTNSFNALWQVEEHFKTKPITPITNHTNNTNLVEEHFKTKPITPLMADGCSRFLVEEHFKTKPITPDLPKSTSLRMVEEHFKTKPIIPEAGFTKRVLSVEEHFKEDELSYASLVELMPIYLSENDSGRLHHINQPALFFSNGDHYFFYRGVYLKHEFFYKLKNKTITFQEWINESNEEVKSAILAYIEEVHGGECLYRFIEDHLKEVDTYIDKKDNKYLEGTTRGMNIGIYSLFKGEIAAFIVDGSEKRKIFLSYVRCYCPSTDRMFFLGVNPKYNNAKDAIASLFKVPQKLVNHIKHISRQGERFCITLTDAGKKIKASLSKKDIESLVSITGDRYFDLMRYEY